MNSRASSIDLLLLFGICLISPCLSYSEELYSKCSKQFNCGNIINVDYPFWGGDRPYGCGHPGLNLNCEAGNIVTIEIMNVTYRVLDISTNDQILKIAREDYMGGICSSSSQFVNTTLNSTLFEYVVPGYMNLTFLYGCPEIPLSPGYKNLLPDCVINGFSYGSVCVSLEGQDSRKCNTSVIIPVPRMGLVELISSGWDQLFGKGFEVKWKVDSKACSVCTNSLGSCGYDLQLNNVTCICPNDQPLGSTACPSSPPSRASWAASPPPAPARASWTASPPQPGDSSGVNPLAKMAVGISAGVAGIIVAFVVVICWLKRQHISGKTVVLWKKKSENDKNVEAFIRNNGFLTLKRYSYPAVKKMTKSFKEKLGQGGYGGVYKGKLSDGRLVAVKVLSESKGNGEDFMNEVASISRTSHVNIVSLLGFCYEETKRALIYEFMPNGSLDKFIYDEGSSNEDHHLEWKTLYQIAIGIARGLEYLHRGCNTRILHFDIKPHNILLDEDFCPKVSDFGLAKLCQRKESIISMSGARGTIGYIAPEVFSRSFGRVSHKSDVYSYGMMVLEMVGGRKNIDPGVSHTSEIYFPHWIYEPLKQGEDLKLHGVVTEEEKEITRKMILVSLWCIQTNPSDRPSMTKVVEMLEGSLQSLQIPPKP